MRRAEWLTTTAASPHTAKRVISTFPAVLDKETDAEAVDGGSVLVDPSKDASLQDLFIIPIRKPLVPGAGSSSHSVAQCNICFIETPAKFMSCRRYTLV